MYSKFLQMKKNLHRVGSFAKHGRQQSVKPVSGVSTRVFGNQAQSKVDIGAGNDHYEQQADQIADQVLGISDHEIVGDDGHLNNKVQKKSEPNKLGDISAHTHAPVFKNSGSPLSSSLKHYFEPRFERDFSRVRIHTDKDTQYKAKSFNARAFTFGQHVGFAPGEYQPDTQKGRHLIAHELTHTLQQSTEQRVQRVSAGEWFNRVFGEGNFDDAELQAYLQFLDDEGRIEDHYDSDNKARAIVTRWQRGDTLYILPVRRKILLIREMMSGFTGNPDENAILALLRGSTPSEFSTIITTIGQDTLRDEIHGDQRAEYDGLIAARAGTATADTELATASRAEVFDDDTVLSLQRQFSENAALGSGVRRNCILIIRDLAPQLFSADPAVAETVTTALGALSGGSLKMTEFGRVLSDLGLVSGSATVRFNNGNGLREPTAMEDDPWNVIMGMVGNVPGWHIFGLAPFNGYHSVTVLVNNRPDGPKLYWADQWRIDPGDDFEEEAGSASGFRRYEQAGFNEWIMYYTRSRWSSVHAADSDCGRNATDRGRDWDAVCRWSTSLHIWKFRSQLEGGSP